MKKITLLLIALFYSFSLAAIVKPGDTIKIKKHKKIIANFQDSLSNLQRTYKSWKYQGADTMSNPYYFMLFSAPTLYNEPLRNTFSKPTTDKQLSYMYNTLSKTYIKSPWLIKYTPQDMSHFIEVTPNDKPLKPIALLSEKVNKDDNIDAINVDPIEINVRKPNFWTYNGAFSFQLIQNYVSDNWYKGGESNRSLLASADLQANYDNKEKIKFNNRLEMRIGFQSSNSDEKHKYKTNSDLLRLTNEFGLKASKHWYYSAMLQSWTQFYKGYRKNDERVYSDFMSPFESLLSLGMKYTLEKKKFRLAVNLSPLAANFKYVGRNGLITHYGLKEGKHVKFEYGSNITATHSWDVFKNVNWAGRFYYYTNYRRTTIEWENTINLKINKYLSTQLFLYPRFDDSAKRAPEENSYLQFNEFLSVGLNFNLKDF